MGGDRSARLFRNGDFLWGFFFSCAQPLVNAAQSRGVCAQNEGREQVQNEIHEGDEKADPAPRQKEEQKTADSANRVSYDAVVGF